jgi:hypothetical protein
LHGIAPREEDAGRFRYGLGSPLDAGAATPLTANDFVALLKSAFSFAVFALLFLAVGLPLHVGIQCAAEGCFACTGILHGDLMRIGRGAADGF